MNGKRYFYKFFIQVVLLICSVESSVHTFRGSSNNSNEGCFSYIEVKATPANISVVLSCESQLHRIVNIISLAYIRPGSRGDSQCNGRNDRSCCDFPSDKEVCSIEAESQVLQSTIAECQDKQTCNVKFEPVYMSGCQGCKDQDNGDIDKICWGRVLYIVCECDYLETTSFETSKIEATDSTTPTQSREITTSIQPGEITISIQSRESTTSVQHTSCAPDTTTPYVAGGTSTDRQNGGSLEPAAQCQACNSCTAPITVLAILLPIVFIGGGVLVHLLYTRCNFMKKLGTKENPPFSDLKGLQNPTAEQDNTLRATSSNEEPMVPYCHMGKDPRVSDADHEYVILADDKIPTQNGSWASGTEKQPEMLENPYYDGVDGTNKPKASGYQNVLDNGVEMTENAYYDGTDDLKKTSGALPNTLGELEMTDNTYYDGTDNGPGIKDCHDGQKNEGEKNYVYTYGHFKLEGRQREEKC